MSKILLVQITVVEDERPYQDGGKVLSNAIHQYDSNYGYEVKAMFDRLGEKYAAVMDEGYEP